MAYSLRAFIGHLDTLQFIHEQVAPAIVIQLEQNVGMTPVTQSVYEAVGSAQPSTLWEMTVFKGLSKPLIDAAEQASASGTIAYVEAEYFNGEGYQAVVVWRDQIEIMGPLLAYKLPLHDKPINRALRMLGVQIKDAIDEFDTLGLGACRRTEDWISRLKDV